jgi:hypothetical protein
MTRTELAAGLGIDAGLVTRYARRGMPTDSLPAAAAWKAANVRQRMTGKSTARAGRAAPAAPAGTVPSYSESRARREHAEAVEAELRVQKLKRTLIDREQAERTVAGILIGCRDAVRQIPARIAVLLAAETDAREVDRLLQAEIDATLLAYAKGEARL